MATHPEDGFSAPPLSAVMAPQSGESGLPQRALGGWLRQGVRGACLRCPRWEHLQAGPAILLLLLLIGVLVTLALQRLVIVGPATFYAPAVHGGWLRTVVALGLCWIVARNTEPSQRTPSVAVLFGLLVAQEIFIALVAGFALVPVLHAGVLTKPDFPAWLNWVLWALGWAWSLLAQIVLLLRWLQPVWRRRVLIILLTGLSYGPNLLEPPPRFWYPDIAEESTQPSPQLRLTQAVIERQTELLGSVLQSLAQQRAGIVDVYVITFAPYAYEDVFLRESKLVAGVMRERFDATGRTLQLVNHSQTALDLPWATPLNLQRAIAYIAKVMNRDEDLLFIHLTSHGAADGKLSASLWPLEIEPVTPTSLREWLDAAGIHYRVISISACYSGSWVAPLAGESTLVMTAADAKHTSYGCGRSSEFTYFGRAIYDEQLRRTYSFEQAHAAARAVIAQRERDAGKDDGYSNPQIAIGAEIRELLGKLEAYLSARNTLAPASSPL